MNVTATQRPQGQGQRMPAECRAGSSVYKKTGGRPEDSQNRKCHVMRVTERERTKSSTASGLQMVLCGQDSAQSMFMHVHTCARIHTALMCPLCVMDSCVQKRMCTWVCTNAQAGSQSCMSLLGSRPLCVEMGLLTGQEITNYTGWTASPRYPVSASQNWDHKFIP